MSKQSLEKIRKKIQRKQVFLPEQIKLEDYNYLKFIEDILKKNKPFEHWSYLSKLIAKMRRVSRMEVVQIVGELRQTDQILSFYDLRQISEALKYGTLSQGDLQEVVSALCNDISRKVEIYATRYNVDWGVYRRPQDITTEVSEELPIEERIKRYLVAEALAEIAKVDKTLEEKWDKHEIDYNTFERLKLEWFNRIYDSLVPGIKSTIAETIVYDKYAEWLKGLAERRFKELRPKNQEEVSRRIREFEELTNRIACSLLPNWQLILSELEKSEE